VFIPVGIPGMGKTHIIKSQLEPTIKSVMPEAKLKVVSMDEIRQKCFAEYQKSNPLATKA
jgi:hypothetical protein